MNIQFLNEDELFKKMLKASLGLHIGLIVILGIKTIFFPSEPLQFDPVVRVDMVALPDKRASIPKELLEPVAKPAPKPAPVITKAPVVLKKDSAFEKIKKMEKEERRRKLIEELTREVQKEELAKRQAQAQQLLKGNVISPGTALTGIAKSEFREYSGDIHSHVRQFWDLPEWLKDKNLKASILVHIDFRGVVLKRIVYRSSGDSRFDDFALRAVDKASPFPRPPGKFVDIVRHDGLILGFPE